MKYEKFYRGKVGASVSRDLDAAHREMMTALLSEAERGAWTKAQKRRQRKSILPNVALYRVLIERGVPKEEAKQLVERYSFHLAHKAHKLLKAFFFLPGAFRIFRFAMKRGMAGEEIWKSEEKADERDQYSVDVLRCLWADTCSAFGCPEICDIFCRCDFIVFGNIPKLRFERSETLGMGGEKCDFCFRRNR